MKIHGNGNDNYASRSTGISMTKFFIPKLDAHLPLESNDGCYKFTSLKNYLQEFVTLAVQKGHLVIYVAADGARYIDLGFSFDGGAWGGSLLQVLLLRTADGLGARNVNHCHPILVGLVKDTAASLRMNYPEFLEFINGGTFPSLFSFLHPSLSFPFSSFPYYI